MAPGFGEVYDRADFTKMFSMAHGTQKKIVYSCTPPVQLSRGLQNFENYLKTAKRDKCACIMTWCTKTLKKF